MAAKKSKSPFEIPSELSELTEKNIEQASAAYGHFIDFLTQNMKACQVEHRAANRVDLKGYKIEQSSSLRRTLNVLSHWQKK